MTTAADRLWTRLERLPLTRRAKRTVAQVRAVAVEVGALVDAIWRRSLQVRVVVSTLALSAAVVLVLGLVLQTQIAGRILQGKEVDALGQAEAGAAVLERELAGVDPDGEGAQGELNKALDRLTNASLSTDPGSPSAGEFRAVLTTGPREPGGGVDGSGADEVSAGAVADVPADLRGHVADGSLARRYVTITAQGVEIPTLIIGQPVRTAGRDLEFYLLFPLDAEQRTLSLVQSTLIVGGLVLLLLLAGIASLVTRQVVRPVRQAAEIAERFADETGTPLRLHLPTGVHAEVDPRRVERIVRNLVANAIDHGEGRPVDISLAGDDDAVAVVVRDHGVGLRPGEAALVFNRFWRAEESRARRSGGSGLGLSISIEDARLHGGWLQAWGEPGKGAVFRLTLPRNSGDVLDSSPLPLGPERDTPRRVGTSVPTPPLGWAPVGDGVPAGGAR